jgi:hypothetical protein
MSRTTLRNRSTVPFGTAGRVLATAVALGAVVATAPAAASAVAPQVRTTSAVDPNDALLRASQMPVVNEVQDWDRVARRSGRISSAQTASLAALDPTDKARRDFAIPGGSGSSAVLTFDSKAEARAAYREIRSWRSDTGANVPAQGRLLYTSKLSPVEVEQGHGSYFAFVFKRDRDELEGTFEWLGVTRRGTAVSVVTWRIDGQDATYEVDPTIASVQTANEKLG